MDGIKIGTWTWDFTSPRYLGAAGIAGLGVAAVIIAPRSWKFAVTCVTIALMAAWIMFYETVAYMAGIEAS
jgi:hypothetical protein